MKGIKGALGTVRSVGAVVCLLIFSAVAVPAATQFYYYPSAHNSAETFVWYSTKPLAYTVEKNQVTVGPIMINSRITGLLRERSRNSRCCTGMRYNSAKRMFSITGCGATDIFLVRAGTAITNAHILIVTVLHAPPVLSKGVCKKKGSPIIIIDPGHGGTDPGRVGIHGVPEKDITLTIARKLCTLLRAEGITCCLTRDSDASVPLDMRVRIANETGSILFLSVHANGSSKTTSEGIESYYYDPQLLKTNYQGFYNFLGESWIKQEFVRSIKSFEYAHILHSALLSTIQRIDPGVRDRGVKKAISQVLFGTSMPAVLVEIGFLSHKREAQLLLTAEYQDFAAEGLRKGIGEIIAREARVRLDDSVQIR